MKLFSSKTILIEKKITKNLDSKSSDNICFSLTASFPFGVKDVFKKYFPLFKWNKGNNVWEMKLENQDQIEAEESRLVEWAKLSSDVLDNYKNNPLLENDLLVKIGLYTKEIEAITAEYEVILGKKKRLGALQKKTVQLKALIKSKSEELSLLKESEIEELYDSSYKEAEALLSNIWHLARLKEIRDSIIAILEKGPYIKDKILKNRLEDLKLELQDNFISKTLKLNLFSEYLDRLYNANPNRPDRDLYWLKNQDDQALFVIENIL